MNKRIILASKSPARREVLLKLNLPFEVIVSDFEEDMSLPLSASELALHLSKGKALCLTEKYPEAVVIAADTFVIFEDAFLGKPKDAQDAKNRLLSLSGKTHQIITGLTVAQGEKIISEVVFTQVTMKNNSEATIEEYVASGEPLGKAGSYAIQGKGKDLIEKIDGDYYNVLGLPFDTLTRILDAEFGIYSQ